MCVCQINFEVRLVFAIRKLNCWAVSLAAFLNQWGSGVCVCYLLTLRSVKSCVLIKVSEVGAKFLRNELYDYENRLCTYVHKVRTANNTL